MSKLLIIGASTLQLPAIKKAKELGYYVAVADFNPHAVGIPFADEYFNASTTDIDAITKVAERFEPNGIITLATDMPMRSIAAATTKLGLPGISFETAVNATDKAAMIKVFKNCSVESPWYYVLNDVGDLSRIRNRITFPCIVKPTDNAGSRGVILVEKADNLEEAFNYSYSQSRSGVVLIEEFMQGHEVSVEVMVVNDKPYILAVTDKLTTGAPFFVEMGHSQQSRLPEADILKIKDLASRAVKAVGINNGPAHVEVMMTTDGPKMIELGARMGGDCITTHLVPLSTGIDMIKATIDISLGLEPDIAPKFEKGSAIRYFDVPKGEIKSIEGIKEASCIEGVQEITLIKKPGDKSTDIQSSLDRVGFVIAQSGTSKEAIDLCEKAIRNINIKVIEN